MLSDLSSNIVSFLIKLRQVTQLFFAALFGIGAVLDRLLGQFRQTKTAKLSRDRSPVCRHEEFSFDIRNETVGSKKSRYELGQKFTISRDGTGYPEWQ